MNIFEFRNELRDKIYAFFPENDWTWVEGSSDGKILTWTHGLRVLTLAPDSRGDYSLTESVSTPIGLDGNGVSTVVDALKRMS